MNSPYDLVFSSIKGEYLLFNALVSAYEINFQEYCSLSYQTNFMAFAFYSTKSKEMATFHPKVKVADRDAIESMEGSMSKLFPKLFSEWFKNNRFEPVTKIIVPVEVSDKNIPNLEMIWMPVKGKQKFLITNYLKTHTSYE